MTDHAISGSSSGDHRDVRSAMWRGFLKRCPRCGAGALFHAYLKVSDECPACHEAMSHQRADDAPLYVTMMIVGHVLVAGMAFVDDHWTLSAWTHAAIWLPLTVILSLWLLPRVKGAIVGLQWANRMHGFGEADAPS